MDLKAPQDIEEKLFRLRVELCIRAVEWPMRLATPNMDEGNFKYSSVFCLRLTVHCSCVWIDLL